MTIAAIGREAPVDTPRPVAGLWRWFRVALAFLFLAEIGLFFSNVGLIWFLEMSFSNALSSDFDQYHVAFAIDGLGLLIGVVYTLAFVSTAVLYCRFFHRAVRNMRILGADEMTTSPGWSWGWYFVPIANLWKPFKAAMNLWRSSHRFAGLSPAVPSIMGWWWTAWLVTNIVSNISLRLGIEAGAFSDEIENVDLFIETLWLDIVSNVTGAAAAVLLVLTAGRIASAQTKALAGFRASTFQ